MKRRDATCRRGFVMLTVLIVVVIAALLGTALLHAAGAQAGSSRQSVDAMQSRALAWSGVQAVMSELASQRESMLDGIEPRLTDEWTVFEGAGGQRGVFRLVPIGEDMRTTIESESAKLDLNRATEEMLAAHPLVGADLASRIVARRASAGFGSVEELLELEGVTQAMLDGDSGEAIEAGFRDSSRGLRDVVTVFSFDPNVQAGVGRDGRSHRGDLRVNLNVPWSERLGRAIERRWGSDAARGVESLKEQNVDMSSLGAFCGFLKPLNIEDDLWVGILDSITTTDDMYVPGLIDINRARADVLACVPGIGEEAAEEIADRRGSLDATTLQSVFWPVQEGILTIDDFVLAVDHITARSMQWRVRVEAGMLADQAELDRLARGGAGGGRIGGLLPDEPELTHRVVVEAVIDVSSQRPRVAYLRDVTMLETAKRWARADEHEGEMNEIERAAEETAREQDEPEGRSRVGNLRDRPTIERPTWERPTTERAGTRDRPTIAGRSAPEVEEASGPSAGGGSSDGEPVDRRIGRWTTRSGGGT